MDDDSDAERLPSSVATDERDEVRVGDSTDLDGVGPVAERVVDLDVSVVEREGDTVVDSVRVASIVVVALWVGA